MFDNSRIIGVDLHTRQQSLAMLNTETGELIEKTVEHDGHEVRKFYSTLPGQVPGGDRSYRVDALVFEIDGGPEIDCQVGQRSKVRAAEPRKKKHDRRDAALLLKLPVQNRFPSICIPSTALRDPRTLLMRRRLRNRPCQQRSTIPARIAPGASVRSISLVLRAMDREC
jgi:transposase